MRGSFGPGGFVLVPLNARHTERELRYALEDSGARVLFAGDDRRVLADTVEHFVELPDGYEALLDKAGAAGDRDRTAGP